MTSLSNNFIVVGGGIAGIMSALLLAKQGRDVTLIENSPHIGGLLGSRKHDDYGWFDNGTHILSETGLPEIDNLIFEECYSEKWLHHPMATSSVYFNGKRSKTAFIDGRMLAEEKYNKGFKELMSLSRHNGSFKNLAERVNATYGNTFSKYMFEPAMKKFTGLALEELSDSAHLLFGMNRIICGTAEETKKWKKSDSWNDERLGFHEHTESSSLHFYPKLDGIGLWAALIKKRLNKFGVRVLTNTSVTKAILNEGNVTGLVLNNKELVPCDQLIWSAPIVFLLKAANLNSIKLEPPSLCKTILVDIVLDHPLQFEEFYLTCYDENYSIFRVTNYFSLHNKPKGTFNYAATIEIIIPPENISSKNNITVSSVMHELRCMGLVTEKTRLVASWLNKIESGFPQPTPVFHEMNKKIACFASESISNLSLVGRTAGKSFFMRDVLSEVFELFS